MQLAILFWFYKELDVCKNRLELLKKHNPGVKIYGLFGGKEEEAPLYQKELSSFLDDFYTSPFTDPDWKWLHGDLVLLDWFEKKGIDLEWDSVAIVQWDMLVFDSLREQFKDIKKGEIFLSGLRELDEELENRWSWTNPDSEYRQDYLNFLEYVKKEYGYTKTPHPVCLFILEVFPREFFERYLTVENKEIGFLEYNIPIYAEIFHIPFYQKEFGVRWGGDFVSHPLNARAQEVSKEYILSYLKDPKGWRIFHPYFKMWEE